MKRKIIKSIANIVITVLVITCFALATRLQDTFALEVIGGEYGLKVELSEDQVATNNLNPGDTKKSYMTISNTGAHPLPVYLNNKAIREAHGRGGGKLNDKLILTIKDQADKIIYSGSVKGLENPRYVGNILPNTSVQLDFKVDLPGEETTDEYQGASITVKWIVSTSYKPPIDEPRPPTIIEEYEEEIEDIDEEKIPEIIPEIDEISEEPEEIEEVEEEIEEIDEEIIPIGITDLPKTGERSPNLFYGLGILLIIVGVFINRKL